MAGATELGRRAVSEGLALARRLDHWLIVGRAVFVYFNHDGDGNAVRNAITLKRLVGG